FFTTKTEGKGSGLGLSIVRDIARRHEAEVAVDSDPARGSRFSVVFPRADAARREGTLAADDAPARRSSARKARLLLIDDEEEVAYALREVLVNEGFDVLATTRPDDALSIVKRPSEALDLVITDMSMPGITGLELAE